MENPEKSEQTGKRAGLHPIFVVFGIIIGLWIFVQAIIPDSKKVQPPQESTTQSTDYSLLEEASSALVPHFNVSARVPEMNAVSILVPEKTTDTQIVALLKLFRESRQDRSLATLIPPTTPGDELDNFTIADIYIFSDPQYAVKDAIQILAVGAHAPGEFYSPSIPFEVAMEQVRGHYVVDLNNKVNPEEASLGFADKATGLYSKRYQKLF